MVDSDDAVLTWWDRLFQVRAAATGNARSSTVKGRVRWIISDDDVLYALYIKNGVVFLITFRLRRSRGEMYSGHGRLCVYPSLHSHTTARTRM